MSQFAAIASIRSNKNLRTSSRKTFGVFKTKTLISNNAKGIIISPKMKARFKKLYFKKALRNIAQVLLILVVSGLLTYWIFG